MCRNENFKSHRIPTYFYGFIKMYVFCWLSNKVSITFINECIGIYWVILSDKVHLMSGKMIVNVCVFICIMSISREWQIC